MHGDRNNPIYEIAVANGWAMTSKPWPNMYFMTCPVDQTSKLSHKSIKRTESSSSKTAKKQLVNAQLADDEDSVCQNLANFSSNVASCLMSFDELIDPVGDIA